jgi:hypothetical protein
MLKFILPALFALSAQAVVLELELDVRHRPPGFISADNWVTFKAGNRACFTFGIGSPQPIPKTKEIKVAARPQGNNRVVLSLPLTQSGMCDWKLQYVTVKGTGTGNLLVVNVSDDVRIPEILGDANRSLRAEYVGRDSKHATLFVDDVPVQERDWGAQLRVSAAQAKAPGTVRRKVVMKFN